MAPASTLSSAERSGPRTPMMSFVSILCQLDAPAGRKGAHTRRRRVYDEFGRLAVSQFKSSVAVHCRIVYGGARGDQRPTDGGGPLMTVKCGQDHRVTSVSNTSKCFLYQHTSSS
jgi:hypothetical protein